MIDFLAASSEILTTDANYTPSTVGTVMFWFRPNTAGAGQTLMEAAEEWRVRTGAGNIIMFNGERRFNRQHESVFTYTVGVLYHGAFTWDDTAGDSDSEIFIDGVSDSTDADTSDNAGSNPIIVGDGDAGNYNGEIGDFRIYNRILPASEIATIHAARGVDGIVDGLVHRWLMTGGAQGTSVTGSGVVKDVFGGNHMTPTNTPTWVGSPLRERRVA